MKKIAIILVFIGFLIKLNAQIPFYYPVTFLQGASVTGNFSVNSGDNLPTTDTSTFKAAMEGTNPDSLTISNWAVRGEPSRLYLAFADSSYIVTISASNTPVQVGGDSLWSVYRNTGKYLFVVQNDSVQVTIPGTQWYVIDPDVSYSGANSDNYILHIYIDGVEVTNRGKFSRGMSSTDNGVGTSVLEIQIAQNSWISFWIENTVNTNDPTIFSSNIRIYSTL